MTRAYIRLDPAFDEHKESYPDGPYAALVATLCLAEHQPERGRFRSTDYLRRLLGRRGRHLAYLLEHGDLLELPDGRVYVDGWDEWQEGDWKVGERVARIRHRARRNGARNAASNGGGNGRPSDGNSLDSAGGSADAGEAKLSGALTAGRIPAKKNGSNDRETDTERLARYRLLRDDASKSADVRQVAKAEVERLESIHVG